MELLTHHNQEEYEAFVSAHPAREFTQSLRWPKVKSNWGYEGILSRGADGAIRGAMLVLVQKIPLIGSSFLYAPRGPVCDLHDRETLADLMAGVDALAKKHRAHAFKVDPNVLFSDSEAVENLKSLGLKQSYGPDGFEGIQARFNYRLYLQGRTEEELLMNLTQSCRRKVRIAQRSGVEVRPVGPEHLDDFVRIMEVTGKRDGFAVRPKGYFARMLEALGPHARLYMGFYEGVPVCGALSTNYAGKVCYVYGASDNLHRDKMPNYLMQWEMIRWASQTGCTVYDFQGVSGNLTEGSHMYGLYQFKRGFNGQLDELAGEFDKIYRPVALRLVDAALAANGMLRKIKRKLH